MVRKDVGLLFCLGVGTVRMPLSHCHVLFLTMELRKLLTAKLPDTHLVHANGNRFPYNVADSASLQPHCMFELPRLMLFLRNELVKFFLLRDEVVCILFRLL